MILTLPRAPDSDAAHPSLPSALSVNIRPARADCLMDLARLSVGHPRFNARLVSYSAEDLQTWMTRPDHHVLQVQAEPVTQALGVAHEPPLVGLLVCHADEEDYVADGFILDEALLGLGVERAMVRAVADQALASGCGAVVLPLRRSVQNLPARAFYASLGAVVETLPSGEMEVAFASLAADDVLARAERRALKRLANRSSAVGSAARRPRSGAAPGRAAAA
jgi:GNAT superfamily N-acetyltransferase